MARHVHVRTYHFIEALFCRGVASCFAVAFASLYVQYPGLFGVDGLEPAEVFMKRRGAQPGPTNLLAYHSTAGLDVDTSADLLCIVGFVASILAACGCVNGPTHTALAHSLQPNVHVSTPLAASMYLAYISFVPCVCVCVCVCVCTCMFVRVCVHWCRPCNVVSLSTAWLCYLSLYQIGQTFLSFQWDILLLEVGVLAVCVSVCTRAPTRLLPVPVPVPPLLLDLGTK